MKHKFSGMVCALAMTAGTAGASTLDFEGVFTSPAQGTILGTEFPGVTISLSGTNAGTLGLYNSACRSDASAPNCTGGDKDLATGANLASSGTAKAGTADTPAEGYILISSSGSGDSFGDKVGSPLFTVLFDVPSIISRFVLIDIDENPTRVSMSFHFADGSPTASFNGTNATTVINPGKDNAWAEFDVAMISEDLGTDFLKPVTSFKIQFDRISGGIASVTATPIPLPAGLPLLVSGLGLMGWIGHRRRKAAA